MNWFSGILVFVMIWWCVLLAVLPWGVRPPDEPEPGHAPSAPEKPMLWRKAAITTAITVVLWGIAFVGIEQSWISFRPER